MASIVVNGDTSGSITLSAPAVAGSSVLTLPAVTDTVAGIAATQTLTNKSIVATQLTGTIAAARLPAGSVLQVVNTTTNTQTSSTTSSYADTAVTLNITPTSATSKILVTVYCGMCTKTANDTQLNIRLVRGATTVFDAAALNSGASAVLATNPTIVFYDSPATTSSTTYKIQIANRDNAGTVILNNNGTATITLMEIAA